MSQEKSLFTHGKNHNVADVFDKGIFDKNLLALKKRDPLLVKAISSSSSDWKGMEIFISKSNAPGLIYKGHCLSDSYDPVREAERVAHDAIEKKYSTIIGFGFGMGYQLPVLLESDKVSTLFIFEPSPQVLSMVLGVVDLSDYLSCKKLKIVTKVKNLFFQMPFAEKLTPAITKMIMPGYLSGFQRDYKALEERLGVLVRNMDIIVGTTLHRDLAWFNHLIDNFPNYLNKPSVAGLKEKFVKMPGIVVAAGPSLDKNHHLLSRVKGRALIVSVGTAMKKIESLGIAPDITVVLESNDVRFQFQDGKKMNQGYLALAINSFPKLGELPFKGHFYFSGHGANNKYMMNLVGKKDGVIAAGGSVANAAFSIAVLAGCDPIIMIGQDLAFADRKFHAEGIGLAADNPFNKEGAKVPDSDDELQKMAMIKTEGYYGGEVLTQTNLLNYLMWFEQSIPSLTYLGRQVINCTEGGAKINSALQMPFVDAIEKYMTKTIPVDSLLEEAAKQKPLDEEAISGKIKGLIQKTKRLARLASEEVLVTESAFKLLTEKTPDRIAVNKKVNRVDHLEKKIKRLIKDLDDLVSPLINRENLIATKCFEYDDLDEIRTLRQNMKQSHVLYKGMAKAGKVLTEALKTISQHIGKAGKQD